MDFFTYVDIPERIFSFSYEDKMILLGSCFVENIGQRLRQNKFQVDINPFGILYNPASTAMALRMLIQPERFTDVDLFHHKGLYHSFSHHSSFSSTSSEATLGNMNKRLDQSSELLKETTRLIVTWGSSFVYQLKSNGKVVSNCHKLPEKTFIRQMLTVEEIVADWKVLLFSLWEHNPKTKVLFTVSPIRHWKDGAHGNQLSKATLLIAVDRLKNAFPDRIDYFPAYEIVMDELRDYRFYTEDMLHPSQQAIDYIWERFISSRLTTKSKEILKEWNEIIKAINHKPFQPESEIHKLFIQQTLLKLEQLHEKYPFFDIEKEKEMINNYKL